MVFELTPIEQVCSVILHFSRCVDLSHRERHGRQNAGSEGVLIKGVVCPKLVVSGARDASTERKKGLSETSCGEDVVPPSTSSLLGQFGGLDSVGGKGEAAVVLNVWISDNRRNRAPADRIERGWFVDGSLPFHPCCQSDEKHECPIGADLCFELVTVTSLPPELLTATIIRSHPPSSSAHHSPSPSSSQCHRSGTVSGEAAMCLASPHQSVCSARFLTLHTPLLLPRSHHPSSASSTSQMAPIHSHPSLASLLSNPTSMERLQGFDLPLPDNPIGEGVHARHPSHLDHLALAVSNPSQRHQVRHVDRSSRCAYSICRRGDPVNDGDEKNGDDGLECIEG
ncbi:hypothetical protein BLNAU_6211 [Blattamonas nauphoetae]|uniref:Uncharacterized protein n=1 Tax=Blattamonas nauphoetae TaxID=2049346 RepID=A0ABQ9Y4P5_9EUKA|nr:hypothetical protein BLNAU_6211 [Blattamonas nauphoetae]